jgi:hypothetical protein
MFRWERERQIGSKVLGHWLNTIRKTRRDNTRTNGLVAQPGAPHTANVLRKRLGHNLIGHSAISNTPNTAESLVSPGTAQRALGASPTGDTATVQSPTNDTTRVDPLTNPVVARFCQALINRRRPEAATTPTAEVTTETQLLSPATPSNEEGSPMTAVVTEQDVLLPQPHRIQRRQSAPNRRKSVRRQLGRVRDWWVAVWERDWTVSSVQVDRISMLMFPIAFGAFNLCYWCIYFLKMDRPM